MKRLLGRVSLLLAGMAFFAIAVVELPSVHAQDRRAKLRISNAGFTITALPLLAAKDWGLFSANGLDM